MKRPCLAAAVLWVWAVLVQVWAKAVPVFLSDRLAWCMAWPQDPSYPAKYENKFVCVFLRKSLTTTQQAVPCTNTFPCTPETLAGSLCFYLSLSSSKAMFQKTLFGRLKSFPFFTLGQWLSSKSFHLPHDPLHPLETVCQKELQGAFFWSSVSPPVFFKHKISRRLTLLWVQKITHNWELTKENYLFI